MKPNNPKNGIDGIWIPIHIQNQVTDLYDRYILSYILFRLNLPGDEWTFSEANIARQTKLSKKCIRKRIAYYRKHRIAKRDGNLKVNGGIVKKWVISVAALLKHYHLDITILSETYSNLAAIDTSPGPYRHQDPVPKDTRTLGPKDPVQERSTEKKDLQKKDKVKQGAGTESSFINLPRGSTAGASRSPADSAFIDKNTAPTETKEAQRARWRDPAYWQKVTAEQQQRRASFRKATLNPLKH